MLFLAIAANTAILAPTSTPPADAATPVASTGYYVTKNDKTWAASRGCDLGEQARDKSGTQRFVVILDFGAMYRKGSTWKLTAFAGPDMTLKQAGEMVYNFGQRFWACSGSDTNSLLYVGLGTNNSGGTVSKAAGAALAKEAKRVTEKLKKNQRKRQSYAVGANDFESWGKAPKARDWFDGYAGYSGRPIFFNYGSADGCPTNKTPSRNSCNSGLPAETIWKVSWSGPAYPVPEIYTKSGSQAKQWKYLSLYSKKYHGSYFVFQATLSQRGACKTHGPCPGAENSASTAWNQLSKQLKTSPKAGGKLYSSTTDIKWK